MRVKKFEEISADSTMETVDDYDINPDELLLNNAHRGIGDDDDEPDLGITAREAQTYNHRTKKLTQFFSTSDVNVLFRNLAFYIDGSNSQFKFNRSHFGAHFKVQREKEGEIDMRVNILKVKDQSKHCIQVIRNSGDIFAFSEIFEEIKKFFGGHVNATYVDS